MVWDNPYTRSSWLVPNKLLLKSLSSVFPLIYYYDHMFYSFNIRQTATVCVLMLRPHSIFTEHLCMAWRQCSLKSELHSSKRSVWRHNWTAARWKVQTLNVQQLKYQEVDCTVMEVGHQRLHGASWKERTCVYYRGYRVWIPPRSLGPDGLVHGVFVDQTHELDLALASRWGCRSRHTVVRFCVAASLGTTRVVTVRISLPPIFSLELFSLIYSASPGNLPSCYMAARSYLWA